MRALALLTVAVAALATDSLGAGQAPAAPAAPRPNPRAPLYRHVGEQYRVYEFPGTAESIP